MSVKVTQHPGLLWRAARAGVSDDERSQWASEQPARARTSSSAHPMEPCGLSSNPRAFITCIITHMTCRDGRRSGVWIWLHLGHGERRGRAGKHRPQQENTARIRMLLSLSLSHTYTHSSSVNHCTVPLFYSILSIAPIGFIGGVYICVLTHPRRNLHAHLFLWNEL